jgi:hypothetical protein
MDYEKNANEFAKRHGITLEILEEDYDYYFPDDDRPRSIFKCRLKRNGKRYTFKFGQSIVNEGVEPTMYDVLACVTKYDTGSFEDFCGDFGYNVDSMSAYKTYKAVRKEYDAMCRLLGELMQDEEFLEIG